MLVSPISPICHASSELCLASSEQWSEATPLIILLITVVAVFAYNRHQSRQQESVQHRAERVIEACQGKINGEDSSGCTPLMRAMVEGDDFELVSELVSRGADPNHRGRDGLTPMMKAVDAGRAGCLASLIMAEADENLLDPEGRTALMRAVLARRSDCVSQFVLGGTRLNAQDGEGMTALMHAAASGYADGVKLLLDDEERAADLEPMNLALRDCQGRTALDIARELGHGEIVRLLLHRDARGGGRSETLQPPS